MTRTTAFRRRLAVFAVAALAALGAGCGTLVGRDVPQPTSFVWTDVGRSTAATQRSTLSLLLAPTTTATFSDTQRIVFSNAPGTRAYYQLAQWTERPGGRFDVLLLERLAQRAAFAQVVPMTSSVRGDLLLAVTILDIYHDDARSPGFVRLAVSAELTDRRTRSLRARRAVAREVAVAEESAAAAVAGFNTALSGLLDELVSWVESEAAR